MSVRDGIVNQSKVSTMWWRPEVVTPKDVVTFGNHRYSRVDATAPAWKQLGGMEQSLPRGYHRSSFNNSFMTRNDTVGVDTLLEAADYLYIHQKNIDQLEIPVWAKERKIKPLFLEMDVDFRGCTMEKEVSDLIAESIAGAAMHLIDAIGVNQQWPAKQLDYYSHMRVIALTDPNVEKMLGVFQEKRITNTWCRLESTTNTKMRNKVILSLALFKDVDSDEVVESFGKLYYETTKVDVTHQGLVANSRILHSPQLPVMIVLNFRNL